MVRLMMLVVFIAACDESSLLKEGFDVIQSNMNKDMRMASPFAKEHMGFDYIVRSNSKCDTEC